MQEIPLLMFTIGFTGGFGHCIGMCGPIVTSYSLAITNRSIFPHILYNLGRLSTYALLGGILGFTGSFVGITGHFKEIQKAIMIIAGGLIVLMGLGMLGWFSPIKYLENKISLFPIISKTLNSFSREPKTALFYPMGILMGFLPCGIVYAALIAAARQGMEADSHTAGMLSGAVLMLAFGLGTVPPLLILGKVIHIIGIRMRARFYMVSAVIMMVMGVIFIVRTMHH